VEQSIGSEKQNGALWGEKIIAQGGVGRENVSISTAVGGEWGGWSMESGGHTSTDPRHKGPWIRGCSHRKACAKGAVLQHGPAKKGRDMHEAKAYGGKGKEKRTVTRGKNEKRGERRQRLVAG